MKKYRRSMPDDTGEWCKFEKKNFLVPNMTREIR